MKPPKGAGAAAAGAEVGAADLLVSSLAVSAGLAPNENPPLAGAADGAAAGVSFFSAGFAPNEKPEAAGAAGAVEAAAGADEDVFSASLAPKENPEAAGAGGAAALAVAGALSAGFPNEKPDKGGLEAGVVEPAEAPPNPEKRPPAALPALAAGAGVLAPDVAAGLFRPAKEKDGIALLDEGAVAFDEDALSVFG